MAPIRVAIVGLNSRNSPNFAVGEWGVQHFKALSAISKYEIVAVCNSSVESAQKAIAFHNLDANKVKAYGSASDVAADSNVDLVVVAISSQKHLSVAKPVIEAGKDIYVEFPMAATAEDCETLAALAKEKGVKTIVGSQAHSDVAFTKLRELLANNEIGKVVDTSLIATSPLDVSQGWVDSAPGLLDIDNYLSRVVIVLGHIMGGFSSVVGNFKDLQTVYKTQTKKTTLLDSSFQPSKTDFPVTSPDTMLVQGVLSSGATASINLRVATHPVDGITFRWLIAGTTGEIELTTKGQMFQVGLTDVKILLRKKGEEAATEIEVGSEDEKIANIPGVGGQSIARAYKAFAERRTADYATFETGIEVHRMLQRANEGALWA